MTKRPRETVQQRLKERQTSLQPFDQPWERDPADPRRAPGGGPLKMLQRYSAAAREAFAALRPYLFTSVTADQVREDGAEWWSGSETYISRIATLMKRPGKLFDGLPFGGDELLQRLGRVQELGLCASEAQQQAEHLRNTQTVEMADLLRMTDVAAMVLEGKMNLPTLPQQERAALRDVAELALESWRERQDRLRTAQRERDRLVQDYEEKIQTLERRAAAAEAELARLRGAPPATPPPVAETQLTARAQATPSRRGGRARKR